MLGYTSGIATTSGHVRHGREDPMLMRCEMVPTHPWGATSLRVMAASDQRR